MTISLIKVELCNALLRMLLVCICSYLQSVLRYNFFKFWKPIIQALYAYVGKDVRTRDYFMEPKGVRVQNNICETMI